MWHPLWWWDDKKQKKLQIVLNAFMSAPIQIWTHWIKWTLSVSEYVNCSIELNTMEKWCDFVVLWTIQNKLNYLDDEMHYTKLIWCKQSQNCCLWNVLCVPISNQWSIALPMSTPTALQIMKENVSEIYLREKMTIRYLQTFCNSHVKMQSDKKKTFQRRETTFNFRMKMRVVLEFHMMLRTRYTFSNSFTKNTGNEANNAL